MQDLFELDYFSILDIVLSVLCLILIFLRINVVKKRNSEIDYYKYYSVNLYVKLFLSLTYALYYILIVDGGDTLAYWDGGLKMQELFWKSPSMYFEELFNEPNMAMYGSHFDMSTGYPPRWIYREPPSWFISKIMSLFTFFCFKSYIVATFILAYISAIVSWKLFEMVYAFSMNTTRNIAIAVFYIPSVSFWCSGVTKDTVVFIITLIMVLNCFDILSLTKKTKFQNLVWVAFCIFILAYTRNFMIMTILVPLAFTYSARLANKYREKKIAFYSIRVLSFIVGILFFYFQGASLVESKELEEAAVIQKDFATNETYEGARYDLGITDYSSAGMLSAFPVAAIAGYYRPFIWEALSLTLFLNGLEGAFFLYLTIRFFTSNFFRKINDIRKHEFFIFAFFFSLLMAYMAGLTSGLLGVLVRFKAPLIPFFVLMLTVDKQANNVIQETHLVNDDLIDDKLLEK